MRPTASDTRSKGAPEPQTDRLQQSSGRRWVGRSVWAARPDGASPGVAPALPFAPVTCFLPLENLEREEVEPGLGWAGRHRDGRMCVSLPPLPGILAASGAPPREARPGPAPPRERCLQDRSPPPPPPPPPVPFPGGWGDAKGKWRRPCCPLPMLRGPSESASLAIPPCRPGVAAPLRSRAAGRSYLPAAARHWSAALSLRPLPSPGKGETEQKKKKAKKRQKSSEEGEEEEERPDAAGSRPGQQRPWLDGGGAAAEEKSGDPPLARPPHPP